jgi:hypothetical protein
VGATRNDDTCFFLLSRTRRTLRGFCSSSTYFISQIPTLFAHTRTATFLQYFDDKTWVTLFCFVDGTPTPLREPRSIVPFPALPREPPPVQRSSLVWCVRG